MGIGQIFATRWFGGLPALPFGARALSRQGPGTRPVQPRTTLRREHPELLRQLAQAEGYRDFIEETAALAHLPASLICALGSRESAWGLALAPGGPAGMQDFTPRRPCGQRRGALPEDGGGFKRGLMQIDYDWHRFARGEEWRDPRANLLYAGKVLNISRKFFLKWGLPPQLLQRAVLAAYNTGPIVVFNAWQAGRGLDYPTSGGNYAADVLNRAGWFQLHGWE